MSHYQYKQLEIQKIRFVALEKNRSYEIIELLINCGIDLIQIDKMFIILSGDTQLLPLIKCLFVLYIKRKVKPKIYIKSTKKERACTRNK